MGLWGCVAAQRRRARRSKSAVRGYRRGGEEEGEEEGEELGRRPEDGQRRKGVRLGALEHALAPLHRLAHLRHGVESDFSSFFGGGVDDVGCRGTMRWISTP